MLIDALVTPGTNELRISDDAAQRSRKHIWLHTTIKFAKFESDIYIWTTSQLINKMLQNDNNDIFY